MACSMASIFNALLLLAVFINPLPWATPAFSCDDFDGPVPGEASTTMSTSAYSYDKIGVPSTTPTPLSPHSGEASQPGTISRTASCISATEFPPPTASIASLTEPCLSASPPMASPSPLMNNHCISESPLPAPSYHDLAMAAHYLSVAVSRITTESPSDLADVLKDFANSLELLSFAKATIVAWKNPITVLVPPLPAIGKWESITLQVQELVIVGVYPLHHLLTLNSETEFQTLHPGRCLKVTGSKIRQQLFSHSHVVVHVLRDEIRAYDCASGGGPGNINISIILVIVVGVIGWKAFKKWKKQPEQEAEEA